MLSFSTDLSIRHQNFAFCLLNLLLLPSSSMEFFLDSLWMNSTLLLSQIHSSLKRKTQQKPKSNRVENEGSHKTETTGEDKGHHGLDVAATTVRGGHWPGGSPLLLVRRVFPFALNRGFMPWVIRNGPFGLAFHPLFTWLDSKSYFSPKNLARIMLIFNSNSTKPKPSICLLYTSDAADE